MHKYRNMKGLLVHRCCVRCVLTPGYWEGGILGEHGGGYIVEYVLRAWERSIYAFDFLGRSTEWMLGSTPPEAMVTVPRSLLSSSSLRIAS